MDCGVKKFSKELDKKVFGKPYNEILRPMFGTDTIRFFRKKAVKRSHFQTWLLPEIKPSAFKTKKCLSERKLRDIAFAVKDQRNDYRDPLSDAQWKHVGECLHCLFYLNDPDDQAMSVFTLKPIKKL